MSLSVSKLREASMRSTIPLPHEFSNHEAALMTVDEYLIHRNPKGKMHSDSSYKPTLESLNRSIKRSLGSLRQYNSGWEWDFQEDSEGSIYLYMRKDVHEVFELVGILNEGVLYHSPKVPKNYLPTNYHYLRESYQLPKYEPREVKYIPDYLSLVVGVKERNLKKFPNLLQNIRIDGESMQIRSEAPLVKNHGITIVVLNSEGYRVSTVQEEWGATLTMTAKEYQGLGLGGILFEKWYKWNPSYLSGGFTSAGQAAAQRYWASQVRLFLARGWYSELIKSKRLSKARVSEILSDLPERKKKRAKIKALKTEDQPLVMIVEGSSFFIYDQKLLTMASEDLTDSLIYGFGFFRDADPGTFLYRIDYDPKYRVLSHAVAFQMARDEGWEVYDGEGYSDVLEAEGVPNLYREGDYLTLTEDLLPLQELARQEVKLRRRVDPYEERKYRIMELAEYKDWRPVPIGT